MTKPENLPSKKQQSSIANVPSIFSTPETFTDAQRMAQLLSNSDMVPKQYRGNVANTVVALEIAQRLGASPFFVMQSLQIIQGRPSWAAQAMIAFINSSGRFSPLRFVIEDRGEKTVEYSYNRWENNQKIRDSGTVDIHDFECRAVAHEVGTGAELLGPPVSIEMAVIEGWYLKEGSKWKTMPETMIRYRAASFFGRLYASDILLGMYSADEIVDIVAEPIKPPDLKTDKTAPKNEKPPETHADVPPKHEGVQQGAKDRREVNKIIRIHKDALEKCKSIEAIDTYCREFQGKIQRSLPVEADYLQVMAYADDLRTFFRNRGGRK